jgi:hypothetical protein
LVRVDGFEPDSNHHCADFKSAASAGWATRAKMVGAPRFELGWPQGPTILQTAAAMPYLPDTRTLAEAERLERSRPVHRWTGGLVNRCHTVRRRFRTGTRATIRTPCDGFGSHLLSQEHPSINLAESEGIEPSRFLTVALFSRQFPDHSGPLSVVKELGRPGEIRTLTHECTCS